MFKIYVCAILTFISIFLWDMATSFHRGITVKVDVVEEYQKIDSINRVLLVNMKQYEEYRDDDISKVKLESQHKIDSLSRVVKTLNNEITRMKKNSIMNY